MIINPDHLTQKETYKLLIGSVVPRPIAWVSTVSKNGNYNVAPFSFFTVVSSQPPMLAFSVGTDKRENGDLKDTLKNIQESKDFVINIVTLPTANAMQSSAGTYPPEVDEFKEANITPVKSEIVTSPRVQESPINMECKLEKIIPIHDFQLVIGRMVRYHVADEYYADGKINVEKLQVVGRLAGDYSMIESTFDLPREDLE